MGDSSKYQLQRAVIFKGGKRPPCILGIPIVPFIFVGGGVLILSFLIWIPLIFSLVPILWIMHIIAKDDDQRFLQLYLNFRTNIVNSRKCQGFSSISPAFYNKHSANRKG